jgi:hypothetical protein
MRRTRIVLGIVIALVGLVWLGQGLGLLPGSVMSGSAFWAVVGAALTIGGGLLLVLERRRGV